MQISAKADYAVRALIELAARSGGPVKGDRLAAAQEIPPARLAPYEWREMNSLMRG